MLSDYIEPELDDALDAEMKAFIEQRKTSMRATKLGEPPPGERALISALARTQLRCRTWLRFTEPTDVIVADRLGEVLPALGRIESAVDAGCWGCWPG